MITLRPVERRTRPGRRFCNSVRGRARGAGGAFGEVRKTVTVLFIDVTGSMGRYLERVQQAVERHGGKILASTATR